MASGPIEPEILHPGGREQQPENGAQYNGGNGNGNGAEGPGYFSRAMDNLGEMLSGINYGEAWNHVRRNWDKYAAAIPTAYEFLAKDIPYVWDGPFVSDVAVTGALLGALYTGTYVLKNYVFEQRMVGDSAVERPRPRRRRQKAAAQGEGPAPATQGPEPAPAQNSN